MNKKNIVSAMLASAVLFTGTAALAAYTYFKKSAGGAEEPELPEEDEEEEDDSVGDEPSEEEAEETPEAEPEEEEPADDLETYLGRHPEEEESLDAVKDSFSADGVRTDITVTGNTMFFDFVMEDVDDEDTKAALKPDLEGFLEEQSESYSGIVKKMEEQTGIGGIKMIVIFMDADEDEIVSGHYDAFGRVM